MCAANANGGYDGRALRLRLYKAGRSYPPAGVALHYIDNRLRGHEVVVASQQQLGS